MTFNDHDRMDQNDKINEAAGFLADIGTLTECEQHSYIVRGDGNLERACQMANGARKKGRLSWAKDLDSNDIAELLKTALDLHSILCPGCAKNSQDRF